MKFKEDNFNGYSFLEKIVLSDKRLSNEKIDFPPLLKNEEVFATNILYFGASVIPRLSSAKNLFIYEPDEEKLSMWLNYFHEKLKNINLYRVKSLDSGFIPFLKSFVGNIYINGNENFKKEVEKYSVYSSNLLAKFALYPKKNIEKILVIDSEYFTLKECIQAFRKIGKIVDIIKLGEKNFMNILLKKIGVFKPHLIFTVNHFGIDEEGIMYDLIKQYEIPFCSWFIDAPELIIKYQEVPKIPFLHIALWDKERYLKLKSFFENIYYLPLASSKEIFYRKRSLFFNYEVSFVGNSNHEGIEKWRKLAKISHNELKKLKKKILEFYKKMEDYQEKPEKYFETDFEKSNQKPIEFRGLIYWLVTQLKRKKLIQWINELEIIPDIFGDKFWKKMGVKINLHKPVNYYNELPTVYNKTKINLNITSYQMFSALNQRVFDIPLAGGFLITDNQSEIHDLFLQNEYVVYNNKEELKELVMYYLKNDSERENIIERSQRRVLTDHLYEKRLVELIKYLEKKI